MMNPFIILGGIWSLVIIVALAFGRCWTHFVPMVAVIFVIMTFAAPFGKGAVMGTMVAIHLLLISFVCIAKKREKAK